MKEKDIYCGNGKKKVFNNGGEVITASICLSDIPKEHITKSEKNGKNYVKIKIRANFNNELDKFGNTHNIVIDTWKPEKKDGLPF